MDTIACVGEKPIRNQVYVNLLGKNNLLLNQRELEYESSVYNLRFAIGVFFLLELKDTNFKTERQLDNKIGAYGALHIPVQKLSDKGLVLHHGNL